MMSIAGMRAEGSVPYGTVSVTVSEVMVPPMPSIVNEVMFLALFFATATGFAPPAPMIGIEKARQLVQRLFVDMALELNDRIE